MTIEEIVDQWISLRAPLPPREADLDRAATFARQLRSWIGNASERFDGFEQLTGADLTGWLLDLVSHLHVSGRVNEAIELCEQFAPFGNAEAFLGDRVRILTEAGRHGEAIAAAEALLHRFPDDAWCHVFAADAFQKTGDDVRAETAYLRALELDPTDSHTVEGVLERLVPWFERLGRADEARRIETRARSCLSRPGRGRP